MIKLRHCRYCYCTDDLLHVAQRKERLICENFFLPLWLLKTKQYNDNNTNLITIDSIMTKIEYYPPCLNPFTLPIGRSLLSSFSATGSFNDFTDGTSYTGDEVDETEDTLPSNGGGGSIGN